MSIRIFSSEEQGSGEFDGGKIIEQRPIGFPNEKTAIKRVGPLFYWAWAKAKETGEIASHPHRGFEIITYLIQGKVEHRDSLGNVSIIGAGGAQVMQTGSGVWHEEKFIGPNMEGFQIWFEPDLNQAIRRQPIYHSYVHEDFVVHQTDRHICKRVIGEGSPIRLETDVNMWDVKVLPTKSTFFKISDHRSFAVLIIQGTGRINSKWNVQANDFVVVRVEESEELTIQADSEEVLRLIIIDVPSQVDYRLYPK